MKEKKEDKKYREVIKIFFDEIVALHKQFEAEKRIMLYDIAEKQMLPCKYNDFKSVLIDEKSQIMLENEYKKSLKNNKILIVISDSICQIIKTCAIDKTFQHQVDVAVFKTIF